VNGMNTYKIDMVNNQKIAIIAPSVLPIPAIQSGGIEQLTEYLIKQNEKTPTVHFTIISAYNRNTKKIENKYKNTNFINIKYSLFHKFINLMNRKFFSKFSNREYFTKDILQIMKILRNNTFDKVVIFGNDRHIKPVSLVVPKEKIIYYQATLMLGKINDFPLVHKIIVGSKHSKSAILKSCDKLKDQDIMLIQSGIDIEYFCNNKDAKKYIKNKYQIGDKVPIVCYLGRIAESKGVIMLLHAAILLKNSVEFRLFLIGNFGLSYGSNKKSISIDGELEIKQLIKELGEKCIVTGFVGNHELPFYLSASDIGLVPSLVEDVSPLTYFQYQAMGIPSIVSDAGGIPEYFSPDYSIMVPRGANMVNDLSNSISKLLLDDLLRIKMGKNAIKNREYLGIERYYKDFINLLNF